MITSSLNVKNVKLVAMALMFMLAITFLVFPAQGVEASQEEVLNQQLEMQEEHRFWEVRTELHRIHHHLEYMPYMVWSTIGIFLAMVCLVVLKVKELNQR